MTTFLFVISCALIFLGGGLSAKFGNAMWGISVIGGLLLIFAFISAYQDKKYISRK